VDAARVHAAGEVDADDHEPAMLEAASRCDQLFRREPQAGVTANDLPRFEISSSVNSGTFGGSMDSWTKNYTSVASAA
jgi:hypothetical protein